MSVTNGATARLEALEAAFRDEDKLRDAFIEAAEPMRAAADANIARFTGRTAQQITTWPSKDAPPGTVKVNVGIPGPDVSGKQSRAFIGRFLEFGTTKRAPRPWLRPAKDAEGGDRFTGRLAAILMSRWRR